MASSVHLADAKNEKSIKKNGLKPKKFEGIRYLFAMPVLPDYYASHQWMRELKRNGAKEIVGVYFRVPDSQIVKVGHYNSEKIEMKASEAIKTIMKIGDAQGYEVIFDRKIEPEEIYGIKAVNRVVGWRYDPKAHARKLCGCPVCVPSGTIKGRQKRGKYEASL